MNTLLEYPVLKNIIRILQGHSNKESLFKKLKKIFNKEVKLPPYIMDPEEYYYYKHLYYRRGTRILTVQETVR